LSLGVRIEAPTKATRNSPRQWRLVVVLPKAPNGIGRLRLPIGKIGRDVRLHDLVHAAKDYSVSPRLPRFGPEWISDDTDYDYREVVSNRLDGLDERTAHAFAVTGGPIKPHTPGLAWGDTFVLIHFSEGFHPPDLLNPVVLASLEGWSAALVTLPVAPDDQVASWLHTCGLRVASGKRQWGIVYPPPVRFDADGQIEVPGGSVVALGFVETADTTESPVDLVIQAGRERHVSPLRRGGTHLFSIARDGVDARLPLHFQWGSKGLPAIVGAARANLSEALPQVVVHLRGPDGDRQVALHAGPQALDAVRCGTDELVSVVIPHGIAGRLRARSPHKPTQDTHLTAGDASSEHAGSWTLSLEQRTMVSDLLRDQTTDICLSFGPFGQYFAAGSISPKRVVATLPAALRKRLVWYGRATGQGRVHETTDAALISLVRHRKPRPHLTAHRNSLLKQLERCALGIDR
jgi:hypothetical protein